MALSMREAIGMSDRYTLSGQNVYVSLVEGIRLALKRILLYEKDPTHSTYVGAIYLGRNALAVIGVEKIASSLGLESLEACLP